MKADMIAKTAEEDLGKSRYQVNCSGTHAWCANWVSEVLKRCGIDMYDWSCTLMQRKMSQSDDWDEPEDKPKRGDILFFDWDRDKSETLPLDHVGIVTAMNGDVITYINGNGSSDTYVTKQCIPYTSINIAYWMRYVGDSKHPPDENGMFQPEKRRVLRRGCQGTDVKKIQRLLFSDGYAVGADDGIFGAKTEKSVINFQQDHKLETDGIVGHDTFEELMK